MFKTIKFRSVEVGDEVRVEGKWFVVLDMDWGGVILMDADTAEERTVNLNQVEEARRWVE